MRMLASLLRARLLIENIRDLKTYAVDIIAIGTLCFGSNGFCSCFRYIRQFAFYLGCLWFDVAVMEDASNQERPRKR